MKNKKFEIFIIIILIILSIIMFGIYLIIKIYNDKNSYILFTKPYNILKCTKYNCENIQNKDYYNNQKYETYINGNYIGNNRILYNENNTKYYVFDENNNNLFNNDDDNPENKYFLLGTNGNIEVESIKFTPELMNEQDYILLSELTNKNIEYTDLPIYKYVVDMDNDGLSEIIYAYNFSYNDKFYSLLAYHDNGKTRIIELNESIESIYLQDVIDVYKDGIYELIINKTNKNGYCTLLYRIKNNKLVTNTKCNK